MKKSGKVTIYDVANETGLSIATVSRVLNDKGGYSEKTKQNVLEVSARLGFVPNNNAITLASRKSKTIGLILNANNYEDNIEETYTMRFLTGALFSASNRGYNILIDSQINKSGFESPKLLPQNYDGVIFPYLVNSELDYIKFLLESRFPYVYAGPRLAEDHAGNNIYAGYAEYKRSTLEMLLELGHQRIFVLERYSYRLRNSNMTVLQTVIDSFIKENRLPYTACQLLLYDNTMPQHLVKLLNEIFTSTAKPDAIYADSISSASTVYSIVKEYGLSIPNDLSVIGTVHRKNDGATFIPSLSTNFINAYEMGKDASELVIHYIEQNDDHPVQNISYELNMRDSVKRRK